MCAISGIVNTRDKVDGNLLKRMTRIMDYRGPDEEGFALKENAGLGHRRLKIIDLQTGQQPMPNEDETVFMVCNGEIYNYRELRRYLEARGHRFRSKSDNEVILHFYEEEGSACVNYLRGMFAFAIWNSRDKQLLLARDRIGKKPLLYHLKGDGGILFASELKSLLLHPDIRKEVDPVAVDLFITYQAIPSPNTIFKNIKKLPPAHCLLWQDGKVKTYRYWDVNFTRKLRLKSEEDYAELLWKKLKEAIKIRTFSDVPLGVFLSGGIDSSAIVAIMSGMTDKPVKTFSVGFDAEDFSELKYAKIVAERFGAEHNEFVVKPDVVDILPKLVWHYNEPFGDSSMLPTYYVARETRKHVTVALNGDGGDESLAGYTRYRQTMLLEKIVNVNRRMPFIGTAYKLFSKLSSGEKNPSNNILRIFRWIDETEKNGYDYAYSRRLTSFPETYKDRLYSPCLKESIGDYNALDHVRKDWAEAGETGLLEKMLYLDQHLYLPEVLTVKMDIATMSNSLEGRSPFLDHKLIETLASFPPGLKLKNSTSKYILKKKLKNVLPDEICKRKKMGFGVPLDSWFRGELKSYISSYLVCDRFKKREFFNSDNVKSMVEEHISGKESHGIRLWNLLVFELWYRIFMEGENGK